MPKEFRKRYIGRLRADPRVRAFFKQYGKARWCAGPRPSGAQYASYCAMVRAEMEWEALLVALRTPAAHGKRQLYNRVMVVVEHRLHDLREAKEALLR